MIEFDQLPSEILANEKIEKRFVNEAFIKQWDYIEGYPGTKKEHSWRVVNVEKQTRGVNPNKEDIMYLSGVKELYRLPSNISNHSDVLTYLKLTSSQVMTLPASF